MKHRQNVNGKFNSGQSMVEYLVICAALGFILFVPINDYASDGQAKSTMEILIDALKLGYEKIATALALPS